MNFLPFFQQQIQHYHTDKKCGFGWTFSAPLTAEALHLQQIRPDHLQSVQVLFLQDGQTAFSVQNHYDPKTSFITQRYYTENFSLFFLLPNSLGVNNYNEIQGHPISESRSAELMQLKNCITDLQLDFCGFLGVNYQITKWEAYQKINFTDNNYIGYQVFVQLKTLFN